PHPGHLWRLDSDRVHHWTRFLVSAYRLDGWRFYRLGRHRCQLLSSHHPGRGLLLCHGRADGRLYPLLHVQRHVPLPNRSARGCCTGLVRLYCHVVLVYCANLHVGPPVSAACPGNCFEPRLWAGVFCCYRDRGPNPPFSRSISSGSIPPASDGPWAEDLWIAWHE